MKAKIKITPTGLIHLGVFFLSVFFLVYFKESNTLSLLNSLFIVLYVSVSNFHRREILPPLAIWFCFLIVSYPLYVWQFDVVVYSLVMRIAFDVCLVICLLKYYRADFLWRLFQVNVPKLPIPQVKAIATLLLLGVFHVFLVLSEVFLFLYFPDVVYFDETPFFYRTFPDVRATYKVILMLGVWSMMIDAYYHPSRKKEHQTE